MNTLGLRNKIAGLEKKKNGLGPKDYERLADLNDMIDYLRVQSKSDTNTTTIYEKGQTVPGNSGSSRAPVIIYGEPFPNPNRGEAISQEDRYHRQHGPPTPTRPRRVYRADDNSIARHRPCDEIEILARITAWEKYILKVNMVSGTIVAMGQESARITDMKILMWYILIASQYIGTSGLPSFETGLV